MTVTGLCAPLKEEEEEEEGGGGRRGRCFLVLFPVRQAACGAWRKIKTNPKVRFEKKPCRTGPVPDTESSLRCDAGFRRSLVSLAFEMVCIRIDRAGGRLLTETLESYYAVVSPPAGAHFDAASARVHRLTAELCRVHGRPLSEVVGALLGAIHRHAAAGVRIPVVGHDVAGDVALLVDECLRGGLASPCELRRAFSHTVCTKLLTVGLCRLPVPYPFADVLVSAARRRAPVDRRAGGYKWPSLDEALGYVLRRHGAAPSFHHHPAHDARGDVDRCRCVFVGLLADFLRCTCASAAP